MSSSCAKTTLNQWCQKTNNLLQIELKMTGTGCEVKYECSVKVAGFDYVGFGSANNRSEAINIGAQNFLNFLEYSKVNYKSEFKKDTNVVDSNCLTIDDNTQENSNSVSKETHQDDDCELLEQPEISTIKENSPVQKDCALENISINDHDIIIVDSTDPNDNVQNLDVIIIESELAEANDEEIINFDENASEHGNWTLDIAKTRLNNYLSSKKLNTQYAYTYTQKNDKRLTIADMSFTVDSIGKTITGRGTAKSEKQASKICALKIVRELYHYGVLEAYNGSLKLSKLIDPLLFNVDLNLELVAQLNACVDDNNIDYVNVPHKYDDIEVTLFDDTVRYQCITDSEEPPVNCVEWSPPKERWDTWKCCPLKSDNNWSTMTLNYASLVLKNQRLEHIKNSEYSKMVLRDRENLPIFEQKDAIVRLIENNTVSIIKGTAGCGKSTQVCQFILDEYLMSSKAGMCNIIVTEPRRIAAIALAERVAFERSETLGYSVGYAVRYDNCFPRPFGSIVYMTIGTLLKRLSNGLCGVSHLIIDEVHERDLYTDFILIVIRELVKLHSNIRIVLMSATIDTNIFSNYFDGAPVFEVNCVLHQVKSFFLEDIIKNTGYRPSIAKRKADDVNENNLLIYEDDENCNLIISNDYPQFVKDSLAKINEHEIDFDLIRHLIKYVDTLNMAGAILIFLPGWNDIVSLIEYLMNRSSFDKSKYCILPLHSQLPKADQKRVFDPAPIGQTKLVVATNIAESSITINDIVFVIDSCKVKLKYFHTDSNIITYNTVWSSISSLEQRKGRAGRVRNGFYFCLCSKARYERLDKFIMPEIRRSSLDEISLAVKFLNLGSIKGFLNLALEPPSIEAVEESEMILKRINALNTKSEITPLGKMLAKLPLEPRLGKMIIMGCIFECSNELITLAAISSTIGEVFNFNTMKSLGMRKEMFSGIRNSDHLTILSVYNTWENFLNKDRRKADQFCSDHNLNFSTMQLMYESRRTIYQRVIELGIPEATLIPVKINMNTFDDDLDLIIALLCSALYPNIYIQKGKRIVKTTGNKYGLIHKTSQNCNSSKRDLFISPFFMYSEKLQSSLILCKQTSMVSPIHLLLFGCRRVVLTKGYVQLDDWLNIKMDPNVASKVLGLRTVLERLVMEVAISPDNILNRSGKDYTLIATIKELCKMTVCIKDKPKISSKGINSNFSLNSQSFIDLGDLQQNTTFNSKLRNVSISRRGLGKRVYAECFARDLEEGEVFREDMNDEDNYNTNVHPKRPLLGMRDFRSGPMMSGGYNEMGVSHLNMISGPLMPPQHHMMTGYPPRMRFPYSSRHLSNLGPPEIHDNEVTVDDPGDDYRSIMQNNYMNKDNDYIDRTSPSNSLHKFPWQQSNYNNNQKEESYQRFWRSPNEPERYSMQYPKHPWFPPIQQQSQQPPSILSMNIEPPTFENRLAFNKSNHVTPYPFAHNKDNSRPSIGVSGMTYTLESKKRGGRNRGGGYSGRNRQTTIDFNTSSDGFMNQRSGHNRSRGIGFGGRGRGQGQIPVPEVYID